MGYTKGYDLEVFNEHTQTFERKHNQHLTLGDYISGGVERRTYHARRICFLQKDLKKLHKLIYSAFTTWCSFSTLITKGLPKLLHLQPYLQQGLWFRIRGSRDSKGKNYVQYLSPAHHKHYIPKEAIHFLSYFQIELLSETSIFLSQHASLCAHLFRELMWLECSLPKKRTREDIRNDVNMYCRTYNSPFEELLLTYEYSLSSLLHYRYKHLDWNGGDFMTTLRDYMRMAKMMKIPVKKYPKNLKEAHDKMCRIHEDFKEHHDIEKFKQSMKTYKTFERFSTQTFCMVLPARPGDIREEGRKLSHCVGSYITSVLNGTTCILFMRKKEEKDTPLVTVQLYPYKTDTNRTIYQVTQAKGLRNRSLSPEEREFLYAWANHHGMEVAKFL